MSALAIAGLVALINSDIVSRTLFDVPIRGVTEIVSISIPSLVFLAVAELYAADGLIRAGILSRWFDPRSHVFGAALETVFHVIAAVLVSSLFIATWPNFVRAWRTDEFLGVEGDFTAPVWPAKLAILTGSLLVAGFSLTAGLRIVRATFNRVREAVRPGRDLLIWSAGCLAFLLIPVLYLPLDTRIAAGGWSIAVMFVLLYAGLPVAFALMSAAALGIASIKGSAMIAIDTLGLAAAGEPLGFFQVMGGQQDGGA